MNYIIIGTTPFSIMIANIIEMEVGQGKVLAYSTMQDFIQRVEIDGIPVIATENLSSIYDLSQCIILNTIGYSHMNQLREKVQRELEELGISVGTYISKNASVYTSDIDEGNIILAGSFIGPFVSLGRCNIIYSNVSLTIAIGNFNFIASGCILGGNITIGNNCFIGLNSTIRNRLNIPSYTLIGCASNVTKMTWIEETVWMGNPAKQVEKQNSKEVIIK
jgi:hypothetical protein